MKPEIRKAKNGRYRWFLVGTDQKTKAQGVKPEGFKSEREAQQAYDDVEVGISAKLCIEGKLQLPGARAEPGDIRVGADGKRRRFDGKIFRSIPPAPPKRDWGEVRRRAAVAFLAFTLGWVFGFMIVSTAQAQQPTAVTTLDRDEVALLVAESAQDLVRQQAEEPMFTDAHPVTRTLGRKTVNGLAGQALFLVGGSLFLLLLRVPAIMRQVFSLQDELDGINSRLRHHFPPPQVVAGVKKKRGPGLLTRIRYALAGVDLPAPERPEPTLGAEAQQRPPQQVTEINEPVAQIAAAYSLANAIKYGMLVSGYLMASAIAFTWG